MQEETQAKHRLKSVITPRELIYKYIRYLPWVFISVALMLVGAFVKLRYSTPIYNVYGKLLVTTQSTSGGPGKFDDIFMIQGNVKINDEIEIIRSRAIASRVINSLRLNTAIYNKGKIRSSIVHPNDAPFRIQVLSMDSTQGFSLAVTLESDTQFLLNEQPQKHFFNEVISLPQVSFRLIGTNRDRLTFGSNQFIISWQPVEYMAAGLSASISVSPATDVTNVLLLAYQTENTRLGVDIVNQYMYEYQQASLEDKRQIAANTLQFIDDQLDTVRYELGGVERNLLNYRQKNRVFNSQAQAGLSFGQLSETNTQLTEQGVRLKVTDYLINYLSDKQNAYRIVPSSLGTNEPALLAQITEFNRLQLERETAVKTIPSGNQIIQNLETSIEKLRTDMVENLKNVRQTHIMTLSELNKKNQEADQLISTTPTKEKQLLEVTRQQNILQELYSYLLQKKLETAIASASTISNIKVVESAMASGAPISPNRKGLYLMALIIGLGLPVGIVFLKEYLNDKVKSKADIQQVTDVPVLGEIGHAEKAQTLVVTSNNRQFLAEQFRIVRSNLQYILPKIEKPVILVTSSFSGEGKSFISTNLGAVLALSCKQTVILEFDIRKPKIMKGLGLQERKGITNYIVGNVELKEIIYPVPHLENLFVIPCGPVPPNPAELLLGEKVEQLFIELRNRFDTIIIDSAPVGLVSDAITLGAQANATIYIVRHNYTLKKQVQLIDELYQLKKLPHMSIIINDINARSGYGGYYGYGGYGYGHGYGYGYGGNGDGSGYFENEQSAPKGWRGWFDRPSRRK
jgi:tyrosine-protein kinase Etk/Wzc